MKINATKMTKIAGIFLVINCLLIFSNCKVLIQGDVVLAGLFGVYEPGGQGCSNKKVDVNSVMTVEAVKWYIQGLNEHGGLPFRIGFEAFETCWLDNMASLHAVKLLNRALSTETILGVLGPERSSEAMAISRILAAVPQKNRLAQVSFSATAPDLGKGEEYPNFVRVVPNDDIQVEMMVESMKQLDWNRIAVVYEDTVYGRAGYTRLKSRAEKDGICIALSRAIKTNAGIDTNGISQTLVDIITGNSQSRPVNGIVLIASASVSKVVMSSQDMYTYSHYPIVMLSEGTNMDENVFRGYGDGSVISKARGTLIASPPYRVITEFIQHWNSIFTNATKFNIESASNPWLQEIFDKVTNCVKGNCTFRALTSEEIKRAFRQQPVFLDYAVTGAHALIKALQSLQTGFCVSNQHECNDFLRHFNPGDMITALKGMDIKFTTDFSWGVPSLSNEILKIDQSGEITVPETAPSYELYNVQSGSPTPDIKFEKVGVLLGSNATIYHEKIRDYNPMGAEMSWPNVRKAQCSVGQKCSECIPLEQLQEDVLYEPGDVYVVGVAPVFQKSGVQDCGIISDNSGYQLAESIRFAVQKINSKEFEFSNFFPGTKIGLVILNSCMSPAVAQRKVYALHKNGVSLKNGTVIDLEDKIIGYVAEYTSTVSIAIAEALSVLQFVQISYASTSPALSDRNKFPYFMRVVTPDDAQAKAMIEIVKRIDADYIQIVYSAGAYGEAGRDKVKEAAEANKICVVQSIVVNEDDSSYQFYDKLRLFAQAKVVIAFLYPSDLKSFVAALTTQMKRGEFLFIGSESWARDTSVLAEDKNQVILGSMTVSLEMYQDATLRNHVQKIKSKPYHVDPWAQMFIQAKRNCYFDLSFDKTQATNCTSSNDYSIDPDFTLDTYDTQAYVSAISLLTGADLFLKDKCGPSVKKLCKDFTSNTKGLVNEILKTKLDLDGSGYKMKVFDKNGDGNIGYRIYNIQKDDVDLSKLVYREIGRFPLEGTFTFEKDKLVYPTDSPLDSRCPNEQACTACLSRNGNNGNEPTTDKDSGNSAEPKSDMTVIIALAACLGLVCLVIVVLAVLLCKRKRKDYDDGNDFYLRPRNNQSGGDFSTGGDFSSPREDSTPSKIYFEIPTPHERRYVPMDSTPIDRT